MTDVLGARLTLSQGMQRAQVWAQAEMKRIGLVNVAAEPFMDFGVDLGQRVRVAAHARAGLRADGRVPAVAHAGHRRTAGGAGGHRGPAGARRTSTTYRGTLKGKAVLDDAAGADRPGATDQRRAALDRRRTRLDRSRWSSRPRGRLRRAPRGTPTCSPPRRRSPSTRRRASWWCCSARAAGWARCGDFAAGSAAGRLVAGGHPRLTGHRRHHARALQPDVPHPQARHPGDGPGGGPQPGRRAGRAGGQHRRRDSRAATSRTRS